MKILELGRADGYGAFRMNAERILFFHDGERDRTTRIVFDNGDSLEVAGRPKEVELQVRHILRGKWFS